MKILIEVEFTKIDGAECDDDQVVSEFVTETEGLQFDVDESVYEVRNIVVQ